MVIGLWLLGGLVGVLVLANLGTMREIVVLRSELAAFAQLVTSPPAPSWLGAGPVPEVLARFHDQFAASPTVRLLLVFIDGACPSCRGLVADLAARTAAGSAPLEVLFVLPESADNDARAVSLATKLERAGYRCVLDDGHRLHRAAAIYGTPSALSYTRDRGVEFQAGVDAEWIEHRTITGSTTPAPATPVATRGGPAA